MSRKFRATVRLEPGEAYVVGPVEEFEHIAAVYRILAEEAESDEDRNRWLSSADWLQEWAHNTVFEGDSEEREEWN